jgi:hypothetical protein
LATVHGVVKRHGGTIDAESRLGVGRRSARTCQLVLEQPKGWKTSRRGWSSVEWLPRTATGAQAVGVFEANQDELAGRPRMSPIMSGA